MPRLIDHVLTLRTSVTRKVGEILDNDIVNDAGTEPLVAVLDAAMMAYSTQHARGIAKTSELVLDLPQ